ncbi:MAG: hypothetical protein CVV21_10765 [Candidatus Goldiibacteriota bacterium HGW-Goldbacteria-1]|jgi:predicted GH43/DUF377 family glycosyl hydrolase|nr:MAG: hypothetical protein CVV21_10765 [Candidatus Goldiibacteriota bacterium HGW-Goldbacteria-1]
MRDGVWKALTAGILLTFFLISCAEKKPGIKERFDSGDITSIKSALTDMWRLNDSSYMVDSLKFLEDEKLYPYAAKALALMDSPMADMIVVGRMAGAKNKKGHLLYFLISSKNRKAPADVLTFIEVNYKDLNSQEKTLADAVLFRSGKASVLTFDGAEKLDAVSLNEICLLAGETKYRQALPFLAALKNNTDISAAALRAMNLINSKNVIKYDFKDRVISKNPYWVKYENNPIMPIVQNSYKSWHTANPDILINNNTMYFYYRGGDGHDKICLATSSMENFDAVHFIDYVKNPIVGVGKKGTFDDNAALDPAAIHFNGKVFLYYSGLGEGDDSIGLAVSKDFYDFKKFKKPVIKGRAPEAVLKEGVIYLYYVLPNAKTGYSIYLATSDDGYNFIKYSDKPIFEPAPDVNTWDGKSVTTPRITEKNGIYYMLYCGDNKYIDYPPFFGLAYSYDLVNWHRGTQNPIFSRSAKGAFDDGGIWYGQLYEHKGKTYMWYEGWGGGPESHDKEYGPGRSQIGLAVSEYGIEEMF